MRGRAVGQATPGRERWRLAGSAMLAAALLAVAGCNGDGGDDAGTSPGAARHSVSSSASASAGGSAGASASPSASPSASGSDGAMSDARARALARGILLTSGDLPGFRVNGRVKDGEAAAFEAALTGCAGSVPFDRVVVSLDSPDFDRGHGLTAVHLDSSVSVLPNAELVRRDLAAVRSERAERCYVRLLARDLRRSAEKGATIGRIRVVRLQPPQQGTDGSFGYAVRFQVIDPGVTIPVYADVLGFATDQIEVSIDLTSVRRPVSTSLEARVYRLLVDRANGTGS